MARKKTKSTYESQARLSVILAIVGTTGLLGAIVLLARNFTGMETFWVTYSPQTMYLPALAGALLVALGSGTAGFFVGFNSAGQKRNTQSQLAWIGFFFNAGVVTLALCAGLFFYFTRQQITF